MEGSIAPAPDPGEPLALRLRETASPEPALRSFHFEYASRGDLVPGRLLLPTALGPAPLVLLQHGAGGHKQSPYLDATAFPWVRAGAAVASIDLPLHGERASSKLTTWLLESLAGASGPEAQELWEEVVRQSVVDLRRALDALATLPALDARRVVYAAFSLGALVGACFCAEDSRPSAAALALAGGGFGPSELDPARHIGSFAPRPLLLVNARQDERIPRAAAERLFEVAREPKQQLWFDATHTSLPGVALKAMWTFLRPRLGLPEASRSRAGSARAGRLPSA